MVGTPDLVGQTFGLLSPRKLLKKRGAQGRAYWRCRCACGGWTHATTTDLRHGRKRSCGCLRVTVRRGRAHKTYEYLPATCEADGCARSVKEKGQFCSMHSRRVDRHGAPDRVVTTDARLLLASYGWQRLREAA